jgi:hypothetical protein
MEHPFCPHCEKKKIDSLFERRAEEVGCETRRWGFTEKMNLVINEKKTWE